jgi:tetratricopeptide (TPR) repeat protein
MFSIAQKSKLDSLHTALKSAHTDSARFVHLNDLVGYYIENKWDSSLYYNSRALAIAVKSNKAMDKAITLDTRSYILMHLESYPESLQSLQQALKLAEDPGNENKTWNADFNGLKNRTRHNFRLDVLANIHHDFGHLLGRTENTDQKIDQYKLTRQLATEVDDKALLGLVNMNLGSVYSTLNRLDSALLLEQNAELIMTQIGYKSYIGTVYESMGEIYLKKRNAVMALQYFHKGVKAGVEQKNTSSAARIYSDLTNYYFLKKQNDSSLYYAQKEFETLKSMGSKDKGPAYEDLYKSYKLTGNRDSSYKYAGLALTAKDSSYKATIKSLSDFQKLSFKAQIYA